MHISFRNLFSMFVLFVALVGAFAVFALVPPPPPGEASCAPQYSSSATGVPAGFGMPYNLFTAAKELLIGGTCSSTGIALTVGTATQDPPTYVYNKGYIFRNSQWQEVNFSSPSALQGNAWYAGTAQATVSLTSAELAQDINVAAYTCSYVNNQWKCGCRDATCATSSWQLQTFRPSDGDTIGQHTLTVTKSGTGSGTVTSSPSGITCGSTCAHAYSSGTVVTLTAVPASNSTFDGWSGSGCSGTGTCVITMSAARSVVATFTAESVGDNPNPYSGNFGFLVMPSGKILPGGKQEFWFLGNGYQACALRRLEGTLGLGNVISGGIASTEKAGSLLAQIGLHTDITDPRGDTHPDAFNFLCGAATLGAGSLLSITNSAGFLFAYSSEMYANEVAIWGTASAPIGGTNTQGPRFSFRARVEGTTHTVTGDPANPTSVSFSTAAAGGAGDVGKVLVSWDVPSVYRGCTLFPGSAKPGEEHMIGNLGEHYGAIKGFFVAGSSGSRTINLDKYLDTPQGRARLADGRLTRFHLICGGPTVAPSVTSVKFTIPQSAI